jgi:hypothetical protein
MQKMGYVTPEVSWMKLKTRKYTKGDGNFLICFWDP